jgi:hypothetical protein
VRLTNKTKQTEKKPKQNKTKPTKKETKRRKRKKSNRRKAKVLDRSATLLTPAQETCLVGFSRTPLTKRLRNQSSQKLFSKSHKQKTKVSFCLQNSNGM